jgi:hypothetical protein
LAQVGVIYLWRFAEGVGPARTFVESYRAHPAGLDHDLHVIFKGFPDSTFVASARGLFAGLPIDPIEVDDTGFDIGSYFAAARRVSNRRLIFFNTFAEILADDWLRKFDTALSSPSVGLAGATGSWQSHCSGYEAALRRIWFWMTHPVQYFKERWNNSVGTQVAKISSEPHSEFRIVRSVYNLVRFDRYIRYRYQYDRYPNPHIRTNAFMIDREQFLALNLPGLKTKWDVYGFESGRRSLTRQIIAQSLRPVVVGRNGDMYDIADWKSSSTYWTGQQHNLIVADNRTRDYSEGSQELRGRLQDNAWVHPSSWSVRGRRFSSP